MGRLRFTNCYDFVTRALRRLESVASELSIVRFTSLVLILGILSSIFICQRVHRGITGRAQLNFETLAHRVSGEVERRLALPRYGLNGLMGLYAANEEVRSRAFRAWVESRDLAQEFPGVLGYGFIERVARDDIESFIAHERADSSPQFSIQSSGSRPDLYIVKYIEPVEINSSTTGLDVGAEQWQRDAIEAAISTGRHTLARQATKDTDLEGRGGFLYFLPLYKHGATVKTPIERHAALLGVLVAVINLEGVLAGISESVNSQLDVELFSTAVPRKDSLLLDADAIPVAVPSDSRPSTFGGRMFHMVQTVKVGEELWSIGISTTPKFEDDISYLPAWICVTSGIIVTVFFATIFGLLGSGKKRAQNLANQMTVEREKSLANLALEHQHLKEAQAIGRIGSWSYDLRSEKIWWSEETYRVFDHDPSRGPPSFDEHVKQIHPEDLTLWKTTVEECVKTGLPYEMEFRAIHKDGDIRSIIARGKGEVSNDSVIRLAGTVQDITHQRGIETQLLLKHQRLELALAGGDLGLWDWNVETGENIYNERFASILGYSFEELPPHVSTWEKLVHSDDMQNVQEALAALIRGSSNEYEVEHRLRHKDGRWLWCLGKGKAFARSNEGKALRITGTLRNVQAEKIHADELREHTERLENAERIAKMGHWSISFESNAVTWSQQMYVIFQRDPVYGPPSIREVLADYEESSAVKFNDFIHGALVGSAEPSLLLELRRDRFGERYVRVDTSAPLKNSTKFEVVFGTAIDVTDTVKRERELAEARQNAEEASRIKSEFLANMSHEIRTPMNGVIGMTQLLLETKLTEDQLSLVRDVQYSGNALLGIVNDILDLSKVESGMLVLNSVHFNLTELLEHIQASITPKLDEHRITFLLEPEKNVPVYLKGDDVRLRQILINLIGNAIKFTPEDGAVIVGFSVKERCKGDCILEFYVSDTGIGISDENKNRIFTPFMQADGSTTRKYGGTGLGLSICRNLVELMGGSIWVESKEGVGSTFYFTARFSESEEPFRKLYHSVVSDDSEEFCEPPIEGENHLLLVEDNPVNQKLAKRILEKLGYRVSIANDGQEALHAISANPHGFVAIFMDCQMPVMSGFDATRAIRRSEFDSGRHVPIIAMTANAMEGDRERCLAAGMDDYLTKPIDRRRLADLLIQIKKV